MSPARASRSSPVWKTLAAIAEASEAGRLTVGTMIRSHRAVTRPGTARAGQPGPNDSVERRILERGRRAIWPAPAARRSASRRAGSGGATRPGAGRGRRARGGAGRSGAGLVGRRGRHREVEAVGQLDSDRAPIVEERQVLVAARRNTCCPLSPAVAVRKDQVRPQRLARLEQRHRDPDRRTRGRLPVRPGRRRSPPPEAGAGGPAHAAPLTRARRTAAFPAGQRSRP